MNSAVQDKSPYGPLQYVKGIGPKLGERLARKGLATIEDALYFLPIRYEDRSLLKSIKELVLGARGGAIGEVMVSGEARYGRRRVFEVVISDGSTLLKLKWFNYKLQYIKGRYKQGQRLKVFGNVTAYGAQKEIVHPDVEIIGDEDVADTSGGGILPVYSQIDNFHQKTIRRIIEGIIEGYAPGVVGAVPMDVLGSRGLLPLGGAFRAAHRPESTGDIELARRSIVFDELFSLELGLALKRRAIEKEGGLALTGGDGRVLKRLGDLLPFELTRAQRRVASEIKRDMAMSHPMNRLLQGDVGSGKTVVSLIAALIAIDSGYQAAIMAPTEILAEQHYLTIHGYAEGLGIRVDSIAPAPAFKPCIGIDGFENESQALKKRLLMIPRLKDQLKGLSPEKNWICFIGRLSFEKHPDLALKGFSLSKQCKKNAALVFAGNGPMEKELREKAKSVGNVFFCELHPSEVPLMCKCSRAMIHTAIPSSRFIDGRPGSVTNASYVGCPVIFPFEKSLNCGGAHESLGSANRSLLSFNPFKPKKFIAKEISEKLDLVVSSQMAFKKASRDDREFSRKLSPEKVFSGLEKELEKLCGEGERV